MVEKYEGKVDVKADGFLGRWARRKNDALQGKPLEEPVLAEEVMAVPTIVTLSYHDAGRWLDAQENVEQVPAPAEVVEWLQAFVNDHHVLEVKRRQRPESFKPLQDRFGVAARVSTEKKSKGPQHD